MKNKKGAEMTIGTIIIIILALVVLVILIYGFSTGWTNLWDKITGFGGGKANVQTVVQSCQLACTTSSNFDYCKTRKLIEDPDGDGKMATRDVTCKTLEGTTYGLSACDITCTTLPTDCVEMDPDRNRLVQITDTVTGCNADENEIISSDTVAAGGADKTVVCCQSK